ncbi:hypothetical protein B0H13DRAFT_2273665, partial [Mycena leptocephala]
MEGNGYLWWPSAIKGRVRIILYSVVSWFIMGEDPYLWRPGRKYDRPTRIKRRLGIPHVVLYYLYNVLNQYLLVHRTHKVQATNESTNGAMMRTDGIWRYWQKDYARRQWEYEADEGYRILQFGKIDGFGTITLIKGGAKPKRANASVLVQFWNTTRAQHTDVQADVGFGKRKPLKRNDGDLIQERKIAKRAEKCSTYHSPAAVISACNSESETYPGDRLVVWDIERGFKTVVGVRKRGVPELLHSPETEAEAPRTRLMGPPTRDRSFLLFATATIGTNRRDRCPAQGQHESQRLRFTD